MWSFICGLFKVNANNGDIFTGMLKFHLGGGGGGGMLEFLEYARFVGGWEGVGTKQHLLASSQVNVARQIDSTHIPWVCSNLSLWFC